MPIQKIINFCDKQYVTHTNRCVDCKTKGNTCHGGCEKCLEEINYKRTDARRYNCPNITFFYVCKFIYRYSSEFYHLFKNSEILKNTKRNYNMMSIGCGPSTELFGLISYLKEITHPPTIKYLGVDFNRIWDPIQKKIVNIIGEDTSNIELTYKHEDAFDIINNMSARDIPNMIIFNYVLSDMVAHSNYEDIISFLDNLTSNVIIKMPSESFIILNDINLGRNKNEARYYFDELYKLANKKCQCRQLKYHFRHDNKPFHPYGEKHFSNGIVKSIQISGDIKKKYSPWEFCTSAQMIIIKENSL